MIPWAGTAHLPEQRQYVRGSGCCFAQPPPALGVAGSDGHTQRQQPERLPPGCPEHFWRGLPRQRCGGIAAGYDHAVGVPRSGGT